MVDPETIAAYAAAGWQARPRIADVLDLAADPRVGRTGTWSSRTCSCITSTASSSPRFCSRCARAPTRSSPASRAAAARARAPPPPRPRRLQRGDAPRCACSACAPASSARSSATLWRRGRPGDAAEPPAPGNAANTRRASSAIASWRHPGRRPRLMATLRRRDRRRRARRLGGGDPAGPRRLVGGAGRKAALPAAQGLRRMHLREQPAAARRARRRRAVGASPAPSCGAWALLHGDGDAWSRRCRRPTRRRALGRALGREQLDTLLVAQARAGRRDRVAAVRAAARSRASGPIHFRLRMRRPARAAPRPRSRRVVIAAHGSWEPLPSERAARRERAEPSDLFAFKAHFRRAR